ncbi:MAG: 4-hydroxythreonine-4-phosphate dehydrogenase PdxA [Pseudanabaena sp. ELA607]|jgi:4-hydroxythreonine-4-phosphate dehydrogenase
MVTRSPDFSSAIPEISPVSVAITMGDPAGIGPEVVLKALADPLIEGLPARYTVVGNRQLLTQTYQNLHGRGATPMAAPDLIRLLEVNRGGEGDIVPGQLSRASGATSFAYLSAAIDRAMGIMSSPQDNQDNLDAQGYEAIVTAPIAKAAWQKAGHNYPGQTELLAERSHQKDFGMLFVARSPHSNWVMRTLLATVHIPLAAVVTSLTPDLVRQKLDLLVKCLKTDFGIDDPRIAVAGINPHSGEQGQLGHEERDWLNGLITSYSHDHPQVTLTGPIPPDTMWLKPSQAWHYPQFADHGYDAYLAMYHDQGLIPVKLLAFAEAVNTTIGLPFVRTSPDHGTAFDIAGRGIADPASMIAAIRLAVELAQQRRLTVSPA